jgi:hypothetical protein
MTATRTVIQGEVVPIPTTTGSLPSATGLANGTPYVLLPGGALSVASSGLWVAVGGLSIAQHTPTSGADTYGSLGDVVADDNYVYAKTSTGWKRSALTTW